MKLKIWPSFNPVEKGEGGIRRIWEMQQKYLPNLGVELVDDDKTADLIAVHADEYKTDKPLVTHNHGLYWSGYDWQRWSHDSNAKALRMFRKSQAISVPSRFVFNAIARGTRLTPTIIYHGVDIEQWEPSENYGYVGWYKNREDPICTSADLSKLAAICADVPFLSTYGDTSLANVTVTGRMTFERTRECIRHAALYLATVKETGGVTILENMASGVVPVGWRHGVNPELIQHKVTGYLAKYGDYDDLREGIYYCLEHREELGANARQYVVEHHQWKDLAPQYVDFYQKALEHYAETLLTPKVSLVVTAYKLEKYLPACLDSILAQDFQDWECIIVDDHSPDKCGEIAYGYAKRDSRIKVITNDQNVYLAEARNIAIRCARGKYILPLDADDEIGENALQILASALDEDPEKDAVFGGFELIEPNGDRWVSDWPPPDPAYERQIRKMNQLPYASMYRKHWWERVGGYKRRWHSAEDAAFWTEIMSYGAVPAKVTDIPTLVYNNRPSSMSHTIPTPDWTAWCTWSRYPDLTPFGASRGFETDIPARPIHDYDPVDISIVIPCGPGHDQYLPDAIDSCLAQTLQNFEVIVVNDTGESWFKDGRLNNPYLQGYSFVSILDCEHEKISVGPARTRNRGISQAKAEVFVLLDADDYLQPLALELLLKTYETYKGNVWVYTDFLDQEGTSKESQDFIWENALIKMPGPITGLYSKADWKAVGGFDEKIRYWEDYSFLLSLMELGRCGVRLTYPAFTYRYDRGNRREWAHTHAQDALAEIKRKHKRLFDDDCE